MSEEIANGVVNCERKLSLLMKLRDELKEKWQDCRRLCDRCIIFESHLQQFHSTEQASIRNQTSLITELEIFLDDSYSFVKLFYRRLHHRDLTKPHILQQHFQGLATLNLRLDELIQKFGILSDTTIEQRREEIIQVNNLLIA
jgi:hypothetical protein